MANQDFDTVIVNPREQPLSSDIDALQSQASRTLRDLLAPMFSYGPSAMFADGFVGQGFQGVAGTGLSVNLSAGMGFQTDFTDLPTAITPTGGVPVTGLSDLSAYKPLVLSEAKAVTINPPLLINKCRRDLICVKWARSFSNETRYQLNASNTFTPQNVPKNMTFDLKDAAVQTIFYGAPDTPTAPILHLEGDTVTYSTSDSYLSSTLQAVPAGYVPVCVVNVKGGDLGFGTSRIADYRKLLLPNGCASLAASVQIQQALATFTNLRSALPPSWKVVAYKTNASPTQDVTFCIFMGDNAATAPVSVNTGLHTGSVYYSTLTVRDFADVYSLSEQLSVTKAVQEIINGTTSGYTVLGGFPVAIGAKYMSVVVRCGTIGPHTIGSPGDFVIDAQTLAVPTSVYTLNLTVNVQRTA